MREQRFAGELVAEILRTDEAGRIHRHDRLAEFFRSRLADRVDVVADHRGNAGLINEDRRRIIFFEDFLDALIEPLLAAEHDIGFVDIGGEAGAVERRAGGIGAAVVPAIAFAGDRTMHQMRDVGDRLQRDFGAVEGTAACRAARLQLFRAALLTLFFRFRGVLRARRLVEDVLNSR